MGRTIKGFVPVKNAAHDIARDGVTDVCLEPRKLFTLNGDLRGGRIAALCGNLWITQQGDAQDYLLRSGEDFTITRPGKVVIQGMRAEAELQTRARLRFVPT